jgi:hypothetical protein
MEYPIQIRAMMFQIFHLGSRKPECSNHKEQLAREDLNVFHILSNRDFLRLAPPWGHSGQSKRVPPDTLTEELKK